MLDFKNDLDGMYSLLNALHIERDELHTRLSNVSTIIFDLKNELDEKEYELISKELDENYSLPQKNAEAREAFKNKLLNQNSDIINLRKELNRMTRQKIELEQDMKRLNDKYSIMKEQVKIIDILVRL